MGGRGSSSGFRAPPVTPIAPRSATETHSLHELTQYMASVGVNVDTASLSGQTFENVREAAAGVERIMQEFPQARSAFNLLRGEDLSNGVLACASRAGNITLSDWYFSKTEQGLARIYDSAVANGFHPAGTTKGDIATHEAGHVLESALIQKYVYQAFSGYAARKQAADDWRKGTYASRVVSEACKAVKKTPAGKGMKNADLIRDVSGYAATNRSEALAECVADYAANGTSAKPLSMAVWNILKRELG